MASTSSQLAKVRRLTAKLRAPNIAWVPPPIRREIEGAWCNEAALLQEQIGDEALLSDPQLNPWL